MADIKQELANISKKLENLFSGQDKSFKQMIVEIMNQTKDEFLKSVEHKIEVLEGKLFEKEKDNDKLKEKVDRLKKQIKSNREQDKHNSANIQE
ncbi:hypothetical protein DPMN_020270 [Dreissena polymorpha]|uniref:Uncharacterized protein n=1 Tax=Dreissena polymorpha TaxID=45954 RepID=A0A9D4NMC3_DREPO|nr:hypothetical protein DPMN_020270 [Dreissena polymorpha]